MATTPHTSDAPSMAAAERTYLEVMLRMNISAAQDNGVTIEQTIEVLTRVLAELGDLEHIAGHVGAAFVLREAELAAQA